MEQVLAQYILALHAAAEATHTAADRPLYRAYLAEAAVLLARAVSGADSAELLPLVQAHERTRGYTWVQGPEHQSVSQAWQAVVRHMPGVRAT